MNLRSLYSNTFPAPGLPPELSSIAPTRNHVDALMKDPRYSNFSRAAGIWFMEVADIARLYWGERSDGKKTPPKEQTQDVDGFVMKAIRCGSHKALEHRQICQGIALMRKWRAWISQEKNGLGDGGGDGGEGSEKWDVGLPKERESGIRRQGNEL